MAFRDLSEFVALLEKRDRLRRVTTPVTWGRRAIRTSSGEMTARVDASLSMPFGVWKTIWSASPACVGKRLWSRSTARCESVFASEKL